MLCSAIANPEDVTFVWKKLEDNYTDDATATFEKGLNSYLVLDRSFHMLRTYICYTNNSVGEGAPCEIQVPGEFNLSIRLFLNCFLGSVPCVRLINRTFCFR